MTPDSNIPAGWVPTDEQILRFMYELHSNVPEADRPMSMSDFSDEQLARIRRAFAVLNAAPKALADETSVHSVAPSMEPLPLEAAGAAAPSGVRELVRSAEWLINRAEEPAASVARAYLAWLVACPVEEDDEDESPHDEC